MVGNRIRASLSEPIVILSTWGDTLVIRFGGIVRGRARCVVVQARRDQRVRVLVLWWLGLVGDVVVGFTKCWGGGQYIKYFG